jgi:hypothetical protein
MSQMPRHHSGPFSRIGNVFVEYGLVLECGFSKPLDSRPLAPRCLLVGVNKHVESHNRLIVMLLSTRHDDTKEVVVETAD